MGQVLTGPWARRPARTRLFAGLELEAMPSPGQEHLITELVEEISGLARRLHQDAPGDPARWLGGFARQLGLDWPPGADEWQRLIAGLKRRKGQLIEQARQGDRITPGQLRKIWATVRDPRYPYVDEDLVYLLVRQRFPRARRPGPDGHPRPSLSRLTRREASRLLEMLLHPGRVAR